MSRLELPAGVESGSSLNLSIAPFGKGADFPIKPIAGFLVVKAEMDKLMTSKLVSREQQEKDLMRAMQQIKNPLRGEVIAVGRGEDLDPSDRRRKPVTAHEGDTTFDVGDTVLFRPIGSYLLDIPGNDFYLIVGDREVLAVEKKR